MKGYTSAVTSSASEASLASSAYWSPPPSLHLTPTAGSPYPYPFPLPTLKSVCLIYVAAGFVYLFTMHHNDNLHFADPRPPLRDFMFSHLPHSELAGSVCDIFATVCIFGVAGYLLFTNDTPAFRWGLLDLAVGKVRAGEERSDGWKVVSKVLLPISLVLQLTPLCPSYALNPS